MFITNQYDVNHLVSHMESVLCGNEFCERFKQYQQHEKLEPIYYQQFLSFVLHIYNI